ncbi:dihydrofolate reductase family protein [Amycolatopsis acidiphila]|nr:dihydrofolate reductase family protein [Amycolatopsis acidiphila]
MGSLNLVQSLLRFGLVDRLDLCVDPLVLGTGKKVFGDGIPPTAATPTACSTWHTTPPANQPTAPSDKAEALITGPHGDHP